MISDDMLGFVGMNVDGQRWGKEDLFRFLALGGSRVCVIRDSDECATLIQDAFPGILLFGRAWWPGDQHGDKYLWRKISPPDWVNWMKTMYPNCRGWYMMNEPDDWVDDPEAFCAWNIEAAALAIEAGHEVVGPNFAMWHPDPDKLESLLPLFNAVVSMPGFYLGLHDYIVRDPNHPQDDWLFDRAQDIVKLVPALKGKIILTEVGLDWIPQRPNSGPWRKIGVPEKEYAHLIAAASEQWMKSGVIAACVFLWTQWMGGDSRWRDYSVYGAWEFLTAVSAIKYKPQDDPVEPPPTPPTPPPDEVLENIAYAYARMNAIHASLDQISKAVDDVLSTLSGTMDLYD